MSPPIRFLATRALMVVAILASTPVLAEETDPQVIELKRQLQERDAEIETLRAQIDSLVQQRSAPPADAGGPPASPAEVTSNKGGAPGGQEVAESDDDAAALERALVLQGGGVLPQGTVEIEPEVFYVYNDSLEGERRDGFGTALTTRVGLPWSMQADLIIPYIIRDHWRTFGKSSGFGDIRLALTKQLLDDYARGTAIFLRGEWRFPTGSIKETPPTGFGQHGARIELTATKQDDPVVLFGNLSYTLNLGTARLSDGRRFDSGNIYGGRLGAFLAATPNISLLGAVALYATDEDRLAGQSIDESDALLGTVELGVATIIARNLFLNLDAEIGFTRATPDFILSFSLPYRF